MIAFVSGTVEATVRDAAGMPAPGLHLLFRSGTVSRGATTDAAGRVGRRLAPGTWEVSGCTGAWDPAREVRLGTVTVEAGATRTAEWVVPARRDG